MQWAERTATSDADLLTGRYAIAGSTALTNTLACIDYWREGTFDDWRGAVLARYTDVNNWLALTLESNNDDASYRGYYLKILKRKAGTVTTLASKLLRGGPVLEGPFHHAVWYRLELFADEAGHAVARYGVPGGVSQYLATLDTDLATGGTLASGKAGIYDADIGSVALARRFRDFSATPPATDAVAFAGQSVQLGTDGNVREDSSGTAYGPVSIDSGDLLRIPPAGIEGRTVEFMVKPSRGDFDQLPDSAIDDLSVQAWYRPSWLTMPW